MDDSNLIINILENDKDKNNSIRECSSPVLYYFLQGRFGFYLTTKNKEEVIEYLNTTFNSLS